MSNIKHLVSSETKTVSQISLILDDYSFCSGMLPFTLTRPLIELKPPTRQLKAKHK